MPSHCGNSASARKNSAGREFLHYKNVHGFKFASHLSAYSVLGVDELDVVEGGGADAQLSPVERIDKYMYSDNVFNRQMVARGLLDTLRDVGDVEQDCAAVLQAMEKLSHDSEATVRSELMEQVPHIAMYCQQRKELFKNAVPNYLLPLVVRYLDDGDNQVRKTSQAALLVLLEQDLVDRADIEEQVVEMIVELAGPDSPDDYRTEAVALMSKLAPLLGKGVTVKQFLPRFCEMCQDQLFHVKKVCAANFGDICTVVGTDNAEKFLLPHFVELCNDRVWGVRKACTECFMIVSQICTSPLSKSELTHNFVNLLRDQSRWVRMAAFQALGPVISTFSNSGVTGLTINDEGVVTYKQPEPQPELPPPALAPDPAVSTDKSEQETSPDNRENSFDDKENSLDDSEDDIIINCDVNVIINCDKNVICDTNTDENSDNDDLKSENEISESDNVVLNTDKSDSVVLKDNQEIVDICNEIINEDIDGLISENITLEICDNYSSKSIDNEKSVQSDDNVELGGNLSNSNDNERVANNDANSDSGNESEKESETLSEKSEIVLENDNLSEKSEIVLDSDTLSEKSEILLDNSELRIDSCNSNSVLEKSEDNSVDETTDVKSDDSTHQDHSSGRGDDASANPEHHPNDPKHLTEQNNDEVFHDAPCDTQIHLNPHTPSGDSPVTSAENLKSDISEKFTNSTEKGGGKTTILSEDGDKTKNLALKLNENNTSLDYKSDNTDGKVHIHIDNIPSFNSFQFWRSPIPEVGLDMDLVNGMPTNIVITAKVQDTEHKKVYQTEMDVHVSRDGDAESTIENVSTDISSPLTPVLRQSAEFGNTGVKVHTASVSTVSEFDMAPHIGSTHILGQRVRTFSSLDASSSNISFIDSDQPSPGVTNDIELSQSQNVIPASLLENYLSMANPSQAEWVDQEITRHCAYSLPAVAFTLGRENWKCLKHLYEELVGDIQWKVRRTLAFSLHGLALILGDEITHCDLVPVFEGFLKDLDEVRIGVLNHLADFLKLLRPPIRKLYLSRVEDFLTTDNLRNWRFRQELAEQLVLMCEMFDKDSVSEYLLPISQILFTDKVACVRRTACHLIGTIIKKLMSTDEIWLPYLAELNSENARSRTWSHRQQYVQMCEAILRLRAVTDKQFASMYLETFLSLGMDPVPNVRISVARTIVNYLSDSDFYSSTDNPHQKAFLNLMEHLQLDHDRDVRALIVYSQTLSDSEDTGNESISVPD